MNRFSIHPLAFPRRKRSALVLLFLTLSLALSAQHRSENAAEEIARQFLFSQDKRSHTLSRAVLTPQQAQQLESLSVAEGCSVLPEGAFRMPQEGQPFYIFNDEAKGAFVVVSGDRRMRDVLGWSSEGVFEEGELPQGLADLLHLYARQWADMEDLVEAVSHRQGLPSWGGKEVKPLLSTQWGQGAPFNAKCPSEGRGTRPPAGCVATAMAQILKYYDYPARGVGSHSFVSKSRGYECSFNYAGASFDWENMLDSYEAGGYSNTHADAVSQLTYACGVSVDMDYDFSGSGAYSDDVPYALGHFFKCNPYVSRYLRDYLPEEEFDSLLCNELENRRPILFCGARNDSTGHAYIIDGVDANHLYHFNWGWSGSRDGYYALDAQYPYSNMHYDYYHEAICRIAPDTIGTLEQIFYADTFQVDCQAIARFDTLRADISTIVCANSNLTHIDSSLHWEGLFGVGLYDENGHFVRWADTPDELQTNYSELYYCWYMIGFPIDICLPGTRWSLKPCALPAGETTPVPMHTYHTLNDSIPIYIGRDSIYAGPRAEQMTGIRRLQKEENMRQKGGDFDLQGRPLREASQGIVVEKGKKVFRK